MHTVESAVPSDSSINILGFTITTDSLDFEDSNGQAVGSGSTTISIDGDSLTIDLGNNGIVLEETDATWELISLDGKISEEFTFFGVTLDPGDSDGLTISYDESQQSLVAHGEVDIKRGNEETDAHLGTATTPGLILRDGAIESLDIGISTSIKVGSFNLHVLNNNPLTLQYSSSQGSFALTGGLSIVIGSDAQLNVTLDTEEPTEVDVDGANSNWSLASLHGSIAESMSLFGLSFSTDSDGVSIDYNASDEQMELFGGASMQVGQDYVDVVLGDSATPGLVINSDSVSHLNAIISSDIQISEFNFGSGADDPLVLQYSKDDEAYSLSGEVNLSIEGESLDVTLDSANPTVVAIDETDSTWKLMSMDGTVNDDFNFLDLSLSSGEAGLTVNYNRTDDQIELYGDVALTIDGNETDAYIGESDKPGLVLKHGSISSFSIGIASSITIGSFEMDVRQDTPLTLEYSSANDEYSLSGGAELSFGSQHLSFDLDSQDPTVLAIDGPGSAWELISFDAKVTESISLYGLTFSTPSEGLVLRYSQRYDQLEIYGEISFEFGGDEIDGILGSMGMPGIVLKNGELTILNVGIDSTFTIGNYEFGSPYYAPIILHYSVLDEEFQLSGGVKLTTADDINLDLYLNPIYPTVIEQDANGDWQLVSLYGSIRADFDFNVSGFNMKTGNHGLDIVYSQENSQLDIFGDVILELGDQSEDIELGSWDNPGIVLKDGKVVSVNFAVEGTITIGSFTYGSPSGESLRFEHVGNGELEVKGSVEVAFNGQKIILEIDPSDPAIFKGAGDDLTLISMEATIIEDFELHGLSLKTGEKGLTVIYNRSGEQFEIYGDVDLTIEEQKIDALMGNSHEPGLVLKDGKVSSFNVGISSSFSVGTFSFNTEASNPPTVQFTNANDTYLLSGGVHVELLGSTAEIELGTESQPGIEITDGIWHVDDFMIEIESLSLGQAADLKELKIVFNRTSGEVDLDIEAIVSLPELGAKIGGDIDFKDGKISAVAVAYTAIGDSEGIEVPGTGLSIIHMALDLKNLDQPTHLIFEGDIGLEFGGQVSFDSETYTLCYMDGSVKIEPGELTFTDTFFVGAYLQSNGDWESVISKGTASLDLDFADNVYKLDTQILLPTDYGIKIDADLAFTAEDMSAFLGADVRVPESISLIGGHNLGSIDAALLIDYDDSSNSFAAGWTVWNLLVTHETVGLKYKFQGSSFSFIGSGGVADVRSQINSASSLLAASARKKAYSISQPVVETFSFDIPEGATSFVVELDWAIDPESEIEAPEFDISAVGPINNGAGGVYYDELSLNYIIYEGDGVFTAIPNTTIETVPDDAGILFSSEGLIETDDDGDILAWEALDSGEVTLSVAYESSLAPYIHLEQPNVVIHYNHPESSIEIEDIALNSENSFVEDGDNFLVSGTDLSITLESFSAPAFEAETEVSLYLDTDAAGFDGQAIVSDIPYSDPSPEDALTSTIQWNVEHITGNHDQGFYLYAQISNESHPNAYSEYIGPFKILAPVSGTVNLTNVSDELPIVRVYLDQNDNGTYDPDIDRTTLTNRLGSFAFENVDEGNVHVGIVTPHGYNLLSAEPFVETAYSEGSPVSVAFELELRDSITGRVYVDADENGQFDDGETGLGGCVLYMDKDNNGVLNEGETTAISLRSGIYRFHDIEPNTEYIVRIHSFPSQIVNGVTGYLVDTTNSDPATTTDYHGGSFAIFSSAASDVSDSEYMDHALAHFSDTDDYAKASDPDNDGFSNELEKIFKTDPTSPSLMPEVSISKVSLTEIEVLLREIDQRQLDILISTDMNEWHQIDSFIGQNDQMTSLIYDIGEYGPNIFAKVRIKD